MSCEIKNHWCDELKNTCQANKGVEVWGSDAGFVIEKKSISDLQIFDIKYCPFCGKILEF